MEEGGGDEGVDVARRRENLNSVLHGGRHALPRQIRRFPRQNHGTRQVQKRGLMTESRVQGSWMISRHNSKVKEGWMIER